MRIMKSPYLSKSKDQIPETMKITFQFISSMSQLKEKV